MVQTCCSRYKCEKLQQIKITAISTLLSNAKQRTTDLQTSYKIMITHKSQHSTIFQHFTCTQRMFLLPNTQIYKYSNHSNPQKIHLALPNCIKPYIQPFPYFFGSCSLTSSLFVLCATGVFSTLLNSNSTGCYNNNILSQYTTGLRWSGYT